MQLSSRQEFAAAPARVYAMLTDEAFLRHAAVELGAPDARVEAIGSRTAVEASVETPGEIRAFVGPRLSTVQETRWGDPGADGTRTGTFTLTVPGAPVRFEGTTLLEPTASGTALRYEGDLTVDVPLLGGRIETHAAPAILEALEAQGAIGREWLAR